MSCISTAERCRPGLARTHQVPRPFLGLTVLETVRVAARSGAAMKDAKATAEIAAVLRRTGLLQLANHPAAASGLVDRKQLEVARSLATQPTVILLERCHKRDC